MRNFKHLDATGALFTYRFKTFSGKHQTKLGSLLTVLVAVGSIAFLTFQLVQFARTEDPVVTESSRIQAESKPLSLLKGELISPITLLFNARYQSEGVERFLTVKGYSIKKRFNFKKNDFVLEDVQEFDYKPCLNYSKNSTYSAVLEKASHLETFSEALLCPDIEDRPELGEVSKARDGLTTQEVFIKIFPCSLQNPRFCAPPLWLGAVFICYLDSGRLLRPNDLEDPLRFHSHVYCYRMDLTTRRANSYKAKLNRLIDSRNELYGEILKSEFVTLEPDSKDRMSRIGRVIYCPKASLGLQGSDCPEYIEFGYSTDNEEVVIRRRYRKFLEVFAEYGGILKLASALFLFYAIYNGKDKIKFISSQIFGEVMKKAKKKVHCEDGRVAECRNRAIDSQNHANLGRLATNSERPEDCLKDPKTLKKVIDECIKGRMSAAGLLNSLNFMEVVEDLLMDEDFKDLIPLVLMKLKIKKEQGEDANAAKTKKFVQKKFKKSYSKKKMLGGGNGARRSIFSEQGRQQKARELESEVSKPEESTDDYSGFGEIGGTIEAYLKQKLHREVPSERNNTQNSTPEPGRRKMSLRDFVVGRQKIKLNIRESSENEYFSPLSSSLSISSLRSVANREVSVSRKSSFGSPALKSGKLRRKGLPVTFKIKGRQRRSSVRSSHSRI